MWAKVSTLGPPYSFLKSISHGRLILVPAADEQMFGAKEQDPHVAGSTKGG